MALFDIFRKKEQSKDIVYDSFGDMGARWITLTNNEEFTKAYQEVPELSAIINDKAKQFAKGIWRCRDLKSNELNEDDKFLKVLRNPNPLQGSSEFLKELYIDKDLLGNAYQYFLTALQKAPTPENVRVIYNIKSRYTYPVGTGKIYQQFELDGIIKHYIFDLKGQKHEFETHSICHVLNPNVNFCNGQYLVGQSPLIPLVWALSNIKAAYEARNVYITRKGAFGVLSNNSPKGDMGVQPIDKVEKAQIEKELSKYGLTKKQKQIIVTNAHLKWEQISISVKDLELYSEVRESATALAHAYSYPSLLLGYMDGSTFSNLGIAYKQLYTDAIIPDAKQVSDEINRTIHAEDFGKEYFLDYSHVEAIQKDKKIEAQRHAIAVKTIITLNEAIQGGNISYDAAVNTLINVVGTTEQEAKDLLSEKIKRDEKEETE